MLLSNTHPFPKLGLLLERSKKQKKKKENRKKIDEKNTSWQQLEQDEDVRWE